MTRSILPDAQVDAAAQAKIQSFHATFVSEVQTAVRDNRIVVVGMAQNVFVKKARKALEGAGLKFHYIERGSYFSGWKERLALKLWSGWPTFPQVFVDGKLIGGFSELKRWLDEGRLKN